MSAAAVPGPRRLRESCDFCTKRKNKCDGDGVNRCSLCIAKNQPECHYSVRLLAGPRRASAGTQAPKPLHGEEAKATAPSWGGGDDSGRSSRGLVSVRRFPGKLPLKRARLSPSPATGLIGLRENVYIADFFRKIGFVPFTTESFIRKAMVRTMFRAVQERDPEFHGCPAGFLEEGDEEDEEDQEDDGKKQEQESGGGDRAVVPTAGPRKAIESAAGACVLWCTVAVGCLVGGRPKSSVDEYARLARKALSGCFDDGSVQTARAFTAMALLQDFSGNEEKFNKYIDFAKSIMRALPAREVPMDLADAHMFVKARDMFDGFYDQLGKEDLRDAMGAVSGLAKQTRPIQLAELCRWLLKTDIRLSACFSMDMQNTGFFGGQSKVEEQTASLGSGPGLGSGSGSASGSDGDGIEDILPSRSPTEACDEVSGTLAGLATPAPRVCWRRPLSCTLAEPPPPGSISQTFAARVLPEMRLMTHVTQRAEVRGGVGELCFQSIMAYACSLQGQRKNAVGAMLRCTEILVKNPGICRSTSWKHLVHVCLNCMVVSGNAEKYEELRASYNSVIDNKVPRAPPFTEFRGMSSICGNVFCKSVDNVFTAVAARKRKPSYHSDNDSTESDSQRRLCPPKSGGRTPQSWARGVFDTGRQQEADTKERGSGETESLAPGPKPNLTTPPLGRFSSPTLMMPPHAPTNTVTAGAVTGAEAATAEAPPPAGESAGSLSASSNISGITGSNSSAAPVSAGDAGVVTAAASLTLVQNESRHDLDRAGNGVAPMPLLPSVLSAQPGSATPGPEEVGDTTRGGAGSGGLELLGASELEAAEAAGLLDAVDALLGEVVSEGFG